MFHSITHSSTPLAAASASPLQRYQADLLRAEFVADPAQRAVVDGLQALYRRLADPCADSASPLGLYLWGPVGRGKSYLMDSFYHSLPPGIGLRLHFHRFMQRIHRELGAQSGHPNPLQRIARRLAREARVLCFDEFFVADIGDAMILAKLLETLFAEGMVLVATSNLHPDQLYADGLQRQRFLPAIGLLQRFTQVMALDGGCDYRRREMVERRHYLTPHGADSEAELRRRCASLAQGTLRWDGELTVMQRRIAVRAYADNLAWFDFAALCQGPRSALDYIEISQRFNTLILGAVPPLGGAVRERKVAIGTEDSLDNSIATIDRSVSQGLNDDAARRFIALVDELYDRGTRLILSAAAPIEQLYRGGRVAFEFERTISRVIEMQSPRYGAAERRADREGR